MNITISILADTVEEIIGRKSHRNMLSFIKEACIIYSIFNHIKKAMLWIFYIEHFRL